MVRLIAASFLLCLLMASAAMAQTSTEIRSNVQTTEIAGGQKLEASSAVSYSSPSPQAHAAEDISAAQSISQNGAYEEPPAPPFRYLDQVCGGVTDIGAGELRPVGPILRGETSRCLLQFPSPRVAEAPRGRGPRAPQPPNPGRILDRVIELVAAPELGIAPSEIGLTGLETYVWVERPAPVAVSAAAGATTVDARAFATQYLWDWGDGDDTLTYDPGRPWSRFGPGSIGHLYETRGRYELSVEVVWEAQWRIDGGAWQALGFFSLSDSVDYPVRQVQARLTRTTD
jgi:hypothetical protein